MRRQPGIWRRDEAHPPRPPTWTSQTILVDDGGSHEHREAEIVTILSGQSVEMRQPRRVLHLVGANWVEEPTEMLLKPAEPCGNVCLYGGQEEHLEVYAYKGLPFDYAIPVLTGWDMQYGDEDHEIERVGVFLADFTYDASTGTLEYTIFSTMRDDSDNGHDGPRYKVSVLGFNRLGGGSEQAAVTWVLGAGLVLAHLLALGEASPARLLNPSALLALRSGLSSFGGFLGGILAALYFCHTRGLALRPVGDALLYGFIGGWLFGRLGCFAVHDHPGSVTTLPTGVLFQGLLRHDLGLYELVYTLLVLTAITLAICTRKRFEGFVIAVTATSYAVVRFGLDVLRVGEATYAGLTLAQWGCLPLLGLGVYTLRSGWSPGTGGVRG